MTQIISDEMVRLAIIKRIFTQADKTVSNHEVQGGVDIMDDAALVRLSDVESLVVTTDFIRGSGFYLFELGYLNYFDVGYYLIAANISDIAAMGAKPVCVTNVIRYTNKMTDEEFTQIFLGMKSAADAFDVEIIGGDIGGHSADVFVATAFGFIKTENALLRKNVQDGDLLCVTGTLGLPITALTYFKKVKPLGFSLSDEEEERILRSWKRPNARIKEGQILSENKLAHACQDISDGLKATVEQMSAISGKSFTIYASKLPIDQTTKKMAEFLDIDHVQIAISASVDFELMFTISTEKLEQCTELFNKNSLQFSVIGEVNSIGKNVLVNKDGAHTEMPGLAWKQQTGDYLQEIIKGGSKA